MPNKILHIFSAPQSVYYFLDKQIDYVVSKDFEVHIILPDDGFFSNKIKAREKNAHLHFIPIKRKVSVIADLMSFFQIYIKILSIKPDILHLHTPKASFIGALAGKLAFQKNIIYQMHGLVSSKGNDVSKGLYFYIEMTTCFLVDRVLAVSHSLKEFAVEKNYCSKKKIKVISNGTINGIDSSGRFNPEHFQTKNKYISKSEIKDRYVVGFIGRIDFDKGIEVFLKVISKLKSEKIPVYALIVGPNEIGLTFEKLLRDFDLYNWENLKIINEIQDPENIMCVLDVLLFPTRREGFGLVAAEANAMEVPVVGYDIPGVKDAIENNKTGLLVDFDDFDDLYDSVLKYYVNPVLRINHGKNGRIRVKNLFNQEFLWNSIVENYNEMI